MRKLEESFDVWKNSWGSDLRIDKKKGYFRKLIRVLAVVGVICLPVFGCGKSGGDTDVAQRTDNSTSVNEVLEQKVDTTEDVDAQQDPSVDVDLTALSATMVYSEVFQMMYYPEDYIGKTVKMEGLFDHYHDDATGKDYYACIIQDATACCAQGIEFQLTDGQYPADSTSDVAVKGTFETYEENGAKYCTLVDAELVKAEYVN